MSREIALDIGSGFNPIAGELCGNFCSGGLRRLPLERSSVSLILARDFVGYPGRID